MSWRRGVSEKKESLQILDRERLASLPGGQKKVDIVERWLYWRGGKVVVHESMYELSTKKVAIIVERWPSWRGNH